MLLADALLIETVEVCEGGRDLNSKSSASSSWSIIGVYPGYKWPGRLTAAALVATCEFQQKKNKMLT